MLVFTEVKDHGVRGSFPDFRSKNWSTTTLFLSVSWKSTTTTITTTPVYFDPVLVDLIVDYLVDNFGPGLFSFLIL